jgi:AcrR family transcriptional regulator
LSVLGTRIPKPGDSRTGAGQEKAPVAGPETVAEHIAREAASLFARQGFDATAVRAIVEAAQVTKPTLYYHFGSKMGLAEALLTRPLETLCATLAGIVRDESDPIRAIVRLVETHFQFCHEAPDRTRLAYAVMFGPSSSSLAGMLMPYAERFDTIWADAVDRLVATGRVDGDPDTREGLSAALRGQVVIHMIDHLYRDRSLPANLPARLVGQLLQGFSRHIPPPPQRPGVCND